MRTVPLLLFLIYFLIINVLFFLPGSALPKAGWLDAVYIDKWVHAAIFYILGLLVFRNGWLIKKPLIWLALAVTYGLAVECIQQQWVVNRAFDVWDWVADAAGAVLAVIFWRWLRKNRPL